MLIVSNHSSHVMAASQLTMHVILIVILLLVGVMLVDSENIYITPHPDEIICPQHPCTSLSQFATNSSSYITNGSNITLYLLPGCHSLDGEITVSNADSFTMMNYLQGSGAVLIECNNYLGMLSVNLTAFVCIRGGLHFIGCGWNKISVVDELVMEDVIFEGVIDSVTALKLSEISFAIIARSTFNASSYDSRHMVEFLEDPKSSDHIFLDGSRYTPIGGAIVTTISNIWIESCAFEGNVAQFSATAAIFADKTSNISILNSHFLSNEASNFSSVLFLGLNSNLHISNCTFVENAADRAVIISVNGSISINGSTFSHNRGMLSGSAIFTYGSSVHLTASIFSNNSDMRSGGILYAYESSIYTWHSFFMDNLVQFHGGVLYTHNSSFNLINSTFSSNTAQTNGGVMYIDNAAHLHTTMIINCTFSRNTAQYFGGVVRTSDKTLATTFIANSTFSENFANIGGVIATEGSFHIVSSNFNNNMALVSGGVSASYGSFYFTDCIFSKNVAQFILGGTFAASNGSYYINRCSFEGNRAGAIGGVIVANNGSFYILNSQFYDNTAPVNGGDMLASQCSFLIANCTFSSNILSLYFFNSNVTFDGYASFKNNEFFNHKISQMLTESDNQGGAITSFHSQLYFMGHITVENSPATDGGAILAISSRVWVNGTMNLAYNAAMNSGGGIYLEGATLEIFGNCRMSQNQARRGGGILASASTITVYQQGILTLHYNTADRGGGLYLETTAKLYLSKSVPELATFNSTIHTMVLFAGNQATYGGAVYAADGSNCKNAQECPLQTVITDPAEGRSRNLINVLFSSNSAALSGSNLYGGLLDRCVPNPFAEVYGLWFQQIQPSYIIGVNYLKTISNITRESISSPPVKVCFCNSDNQPDCDYRLPAIQVKKGEAFTVSVAAIDNVDHLLNANIISSLSSLDGGFSEGQQTQNVKNNCTDLTFNVFSPHDFEIITLAADGPCGGSLSSVREVHVEFTNCTCPIGFEPSNWRQTRCECICHSLLFPYIVQCNITTSTITRFDTNSWIAYINDTDNSGYVVHPHCPFAHCFSRTEVVSIDLSTIDGANAQCQYNRSGILCGSCQEDFTLSLGSSRCLACHRNWPLVSIVILFTSVFAGIFLVIMLLVLNMTVADGLINSFVFYANVVAASGAVFFPSSEPIFPTIFIAWLNLDIGFDVCFFPGLDAYSKTWIQLVFPVYIISLVCIIIIISKYSSMFARQIGRRDPIATLATLILLSYTKLLSTTIAILSFANLRYPDGSHVRVWLADGNILYFKGKHVPLVIVSGIIIMIGVPYTAILFSWQWLVQLPNWIIFKWTRDTKLNGFISTHHAPYNSKHRYWPGLLLLVRITLYITSAVTLSSNPQVPLLLTIILIGAIFFIKCIKGIRVYRKFYAELIETVMHLNLLYYAAFTLYDFKKNTKKQMAIAYTSTTITFVLLIGVIIHHTVELVKQQNSRRKLNTKTPPTLAITNQIYVSCDNTEHKEVVTFSVMEISESLSNSPEPTLHELTQTQDHTELSTNESSDTNEEQDTY